MIEVLIATAVFATAIVAIIGLMSPLSRRVEDVIDSETAARLAGSIQAELKRVGYDTVNSVIADQDTLYLYATPDGRRVLRGPEPSPEGDEDISTTMVVNNDLKIESPGIPGIAKRDR